MLEDSKASLRIDLLLGEMDRSIGDLSHAMHGSQSYRTPEHGRGSSKLAPHSPQRGLSTAAAGRLLQCKEERDMLRNAMYGRSDMEAANHLADELKGRNLSFYDGSQTCRMYDGSYAQDLVNEEAMFIARKRSRSPSRATHR